MRLADLADIEVGYAFPSAEFVGNGDGPRLVRGDNIGHGTLRWKESTTWRWPDVFPDTRYQLASGDLVLGMDRPWIGSGIKFAVVQDVDLPALLVQRVARLRARPLVPQAALRYLVMDPTYASYVQSVQTGTAIPHVSASQIGDYPVPDGVLERAGAIAEVLGALDGRISTNERIMATCDQLAASLVRKATLGADGRPLGEVASITMGSSPMGESLNEDGIGIPFFQGVRDFGLRAPSRRVYTVAPTRMAQESEILLSVRAPVGRVNRAREICCIGRGLASIDAHGRYGSALLHVLRQVPDAWEPFESGGTVFGSIGRKDLETIQVPWPCEQELDPIIPVIDAAETRLEAAERESALLSTLRDTLLPALMSGRLSVRDAEAAVSESV